MQQVFVSTDITRGDYKRVINKVLGGPQAEERFIVNQKTLRVEALLTAARNSYNFNLYENPGADRPQEVKLNRNNLFVMTHIALNLTKQNTEENPAQYGNFPLFTSPDPNYFSGENGTDPAEYLALENVYNGALTISTKPVERLSAFVANLLRYMPNRGYMLPNDTETIPGQINPEWPEYGPTMEHRGFFKLTPNIILDGKEDNSIRLDLGSGNTVNIAGATNAAEEAVDTRNVLVFLLHGFEVVNGAQAANRWTAL